MFQLSLDVFITCDQMPLCKHQIIHMFAIEGDHLSMTHIWVLHVKKSLVVNCIMYNAWNWIVPFDRIVTSMGWQYSLRI
jgi:hypothetical protein